jgi:hypothetical protein
MTPEQIALVPWVSCRNWPQLSAVGAHFHRQLFTRDPACGRCSLRT